MFLLAALKTALTFAGFVVIYFWARGKITQAAQAVDRRRSRRGQ
jgi:hypothetical protein